MLEKTSTPNDLPTARVFLVDIEDIDLYEMLEAYTEFISPERMKKIIRLAHMSDKKLSFGAEIALCFALRSFSLPYSPPAYRYDEWGKPYLENCDDTYISISHSGSLAVCVAAKFPIAVDVLETDYYIASTFQRKVITKYDKEPSDKKELLALWTKKESYVKLTGKGLRTSMLSFSIDGEEATSHTGGSSAFINFRESNGYFISLASYDKTNAQYFNLRKCDFPILLKNGKKEGIL